MQRYLNTVMQEIALWGDRLGSLPVETIFFGGGTPSLLPANALAAIIGRIRRSFSITPTAEISIEANPESVASMETMHILRDAGVNRLSLGVQSLDNATLHSLGRPHTSREAIRTFELARTMGFSNINIDLIWGLPDQRLKLWLDDLKRITKLGPEHLSCYGLTVEEGTPLEKDCLQGKLSLPNENEQAKMFLYGAEYLESRGYLHYEISNFAKMGFSCRHNLGYWEGADYLGVGPSAVSTIRGRRWADPLDFAEYEQAVSSGTIGTLTERLTPFERVQELVMLRLRTSRGLRLKAYRKITGHDFVKDHRELIHALHKNGLIRLRNGYLTLTPNGMLVSNTILENIFSRMEETLPEHMHAAELP